MNVVIDIETVPSADKQRFLEEAATNFKAPSTLTKAEAGADLNMSADEIKYINAKDLTAKWEKEMAVIKAPEVAEQAWRKTSLDGTYGRVLSIAWLIDSDAGHDGLVINNPDLERDTLIAFNTKLSRQLDLEGRPPTFIGHNLEWDLKFLFRRCVILGVKPLFDLPFKGRHDKDYFCTMQAWCGYQERISLANLCAALDIEVKCEMDGSQVCDYWLANRYDEIGEYNAEDVRATLAAYKKLTFA